MLLCGLITVFTVLTAAKGTPKSDNDVLGLPPLDVPVSPHTAQQIRLGQQLFFDKRLSADGTVSCASCHQPEQAFSDAKKVSVGVADRTGTRNAPSLLNAAFNTSQFWDGRRSSLETQALEPFMNAREHGLSNGQELLDKLRADPTYLSAFKAAFDIASEGIHIEHVGQAIAAFERTLVTGNSPVDRYLFNGEKSLSPSAERGLVLFRGRAQCASCHLIGRTNALLTDHQFHRLGIGWQQIQQRLPELTTRLVTARQQNRSLDATLLSDDDLAELGRFAVTLDPRDIGKFRTPSLRNVALTAPHMHDGSVATLEEAVELEIYYRGTANGRPLILTSVEKADLVAFLHALTSPQALTFKPMQAEQTPQPTSK